MDYWTFTLLLLYNYVGKNVCDRIAKPRKCLLEAASVGEAVYENMLHKMNIILVVVVGHPGGRGVKLL